jgi:hypothetical protein
MGAIDAIGLLVILNVIRPFIEGFWLLSNEILLKFHFTPFSGYLQEKRLIERRYNNDIRAQHYYLFLRPAIDTIISEIIPIRNTINFANAKLEYMKANQSGNPKGSSNIIRRNMFSIASNNPEIGNNSATI